MIILRISKKIRSTKGELSDGEQQQTIINSFFIYSRLGVRYQEENGEHEN